MTLSLLSRISSNDLPGVKRRIIKKKSGKEVLLCDKHEGWYHGKLISDTTNACYRLKIAHSDKIVELEYPDLRVFYTLD